MSARVGEEEDGAAAGARPQPETLAAVGTLVYRAHRIQSFLRMVVCAWVAYFLQDAIPGRWHSATLDVVVGSFTLALLTWAGRGNAEQRAPMATHLGLGFSMLGLIFGSLLSGQSESPTIYYFACIPVAAAWLLDVRAAAFWTAVAIAATAGVQLSQDWIQIPPEFVPVGAELLLARVLLVLIFFYLGYASWRSSALQVAALEAREITIASQARELAAARDEALRASRVKGEFLASMSHEIRTPMNAVIGLTGLLLDTHLEDDQRGMLETVRTSGDALLTILNDILDFSKIESGHIELERQPFELRTCVEEALELLAPRAAEKGLALVCRFGDEVPAVVLGDVMRLRQILVNLLSNAIKFTSEGEVVVTVAATSTGAGRHAVRIAVRDTGIGIPSDRLDRLFQSFSQVDASTTRRFGGTGLGLAISKRLAELMGGTIQVESKPGVGSTFFVNLVLEDAAEEKEAEHARDARMRILGGRGPGIEVGMAERLPLRILLAEDNPVNQKVALLMLQRMGYRADLVGNGLDALEATSRQSYDVILMDMQMPELDGVEATRRIRARTGRVGGPRIIALTANAMAEDRAACLAAGMDDFLSKPLTPSQLAAALERCGEGRT